MSLLCTLCLESAPPHTHSRGLGSSRVAAATNSVLLSLIQLQQGLPAADLECDKGAGGVCGERRLEKAVRL